MPWKRRSTFRRRRQTVPTALSPGVIGVFPTRCRGHRAVLESRAGAVACLINWSDDFAGDAAGFGQHCLKVIHAEIAEETLSQCLREPRAVFEREAHVRDRGMISHGQPPWRRHKRKDVTEYSAFIILYGISQTLL